jgi:hypothetical protein
MNEKIFYTKLTGLAGMVPGFTLTPEVIGLYDQHLSPIGYEKVCRALDQIILERNSRDPFPSIKEIMMLIDPELDPDQEAMVIASRIAGAVARIGPYQSELARQMIGDIGWQVVKSEGGWENVCQMLTYENQSTMKAQWRNLAKAYMNRSKNSYAALEYSPKPAGLVSFSEVFKSINNERSNHGEKDDQENKIYKKM